jgi:hypothetical protein
MVQRVVHQDLLFRAPLGTYLSQVQAAEQDALKHFHGREDALLAHISPQDIQQMTAGFQLLPGASAVDAFSCWPKDVLLELVTPEKGPHVPNAQHSPTFLPSTLRHHKESVRTIPPLFWTRLTTVAPSTKPTDSSEPQENSDNKKRSQLPLLPRQSMIPAGTLSTQTSNVCPPVQLGPSSHGSPPSRPPQPTLAYRRGQQSPFPSFYFNRSVRSRQADTTAHVLLCQLIFEIPVIQVIPAIPMIQVILPTHRQPVPLRHTMSRPPSRRRCHSSLPPPTGLPPDSLFSHPGPSQTDRLTIPSRPLYAATATHPRYKPQLTRPTPQEAFSPAQAPARHELHHDLDSTKQLHQVRLATP